MLKKYFIVTGLCLLSATAIATDMIQIDAGIYRPLYLTKESPLTEVSPFLIDKYPVTNAQFFKFIENHPHWQRENIKPIFAEKNYLIHWEKEAKLFRPLPADNDKPVTNISWFAAQAYCQAEGKTLPSVAQWEYIAQASESDPKGYNDPQYTKKILQWYGTSATQPLSNIGLMPANFWGIHDLHGLIWEWTYDFNNALVMGDSRSDSYLDQQMFCGSGAAGAADPNDYAAFMRYGFRASLQATYTLNQLGFRCAAIQE